MWRGIENPIHSPVELITVNKYEEN